MAKPIYTEELKALIANEIKNQNLHEVLPEDAIERIKERIMNTGRQKDTKEIPDVVSELDIPAFPNSEEDRKFPEGENLVVSPEQQVNMTADTQNLFIPSGSEPTEQMSDPKMGYTPELPDMLKKAEPGQLVVFQYNDIGESGENLSFKPMRLMDDPDVKKSMNDLWVEEGKTKAEVYVAKFEKIGEIEFNYADGTSKFLEKPSLPDYAGGPDYKDNPYKAPSTPQIDGQTQGELETYIKSSVDLEKVVRDIVMGIVRDSLLTNTEKAVNEDIDAPEGERGGWGAREDQAVKPMEESIENDEEELFELTMQEIVESDKFTKSILPEELNENINSGNKSMLVNENETVQEWEFQGKKYYTPVGRISKDKGYIKY